MAIEIVDFPMKNLVIFHSYVNVYQAGYLGTHLNRGFFSTDFPTSLRKKHGWEIPANWHGHFESMGKSWSFQWWIQRLPSGNLTFCHGKIHHFSWENPLFRWPFSIAMLVYQRVYPINIPLNHYKIPLNPQQTWSCQVKSSNSTWRL